MRSALARLGAVALCLTLSACTLSRPHYRSPDVAVGEPAFVRTIEAQTDAPLVKGNRAQVLLNGDEIFPAMLESIARANNTVDLLTFVYWEGRIGREFARALAARSHEFEGVSHPGCALAGDGKRP